MEEDRKNGAIEKGSLRQRLAALYKAASSPEKKGYNAFHRYHFVRESDVANLLRPLFAEHGIVVSMSMVDRRTEKIEVVKADDKTAVRYFTSVTLRYEISSADDPNDKIVADAFGDALDDQDKGIYKAVTGAQKYFMMKFFHLGSDVDDDPEHDGQSSGNGQPQPRPKRSSAAPPPVARAAYVDASKAGDQIEDCLSYLKSVGAKPVIGSVYMVAHADKKLSRLVVSEESVEEMKKKAKDDDLPDWWASASGNGKAP